MMKRRCSRFGRFEGQPVRMFTDDGRSHRGIRIGMDDGVFRLVAGRNCVEDIFRCHVASRQRPLMTLHKHCCD